MRSYKSNRNIFTNFYGIAFISNTFISMAGILFAILIFKVKITLTAVLEIMHVWSVIFCIFADFFILIFYTAKCNKWYCLFLNFFFQSLKFFRFFRWLCKFEQVLSRAFRQIFWATIMLIVLVLAFAQLGYLVSEILNVCLLFTLLVSQKFVSFTLSICCVWIFARVGSYLSR